MNKEPLVLMEKKLLQYQKLLLLILVVLVSACEPRDVRPGLWLQGEEVTNLVEDWRFTDEIQEILIETHPWYQLAHSTTIWCVRFGGKLYIGSYGTEKKFWEKNIQRDAKARISIAGKIYKVNISKLNDEMLTRDIGIAYNQKYDMAEVFGEDIPQWWFYLVEQEI